MTKIIHENHTECPSCKNFTLPPITGGNATTCTNPACLAIIDIYRKIIGRLEDGIAVYKKIKPEAVVERITNPISPYIKLEDLSRIESCLDQILLAISGIHERISEIRNR